MQSIRSTPGAVRLFATSVIGRLPLAMLSIALLMHAQHLTDSFAAAGLVDGAYAVAAAVGGPLLGRLVDRRGQTRVLLGSAGAAAILLAALAALPQETPLQVIVVLALALGMTVPPVGACLRALLSDLPLDADAAARAYAVDATIVELTWITGPAIAVGIGAAVSTAAALAAAGTILLAGTLSFAANPASRQWRPAKPGSAARGSALRSPAIRTLLIALVAVGAVFGATQVGVAAATIRLGHPGTTGPLLALWGAGSMIGGFVAARLGGGARDAAALTAILAALAATHLALLAGAGSVVMLGALLVVAGSAIAPTYASVYAMVDRAAPAGAVTEAFAWLATAVAIGSAAGASLAGSLVDQVGPRAAFAVAGFAGAGAVAVIALGSAALGRRPVALPS